MRAVSDKCTHWWEAKLRIDNNIQNDIKGEMMKKNYLRLLSAFFGLATLSAAAQGQASDKLVVKIPYEFVVAGKTLPAGTYKISCISNFDVNELVISSLENRAAVVVLSSNVVDRARAEQPAVTFQHIADQHFLEKIETAVHVFTIPVTKSVVLENCNRKGRIVRSGRRVQEAN